MGKLTERLLKVTHEESCCCEECKCEEHKENLSEEEIEQIINEKYSEKDEKTKEFIRRSLKIHGLRYDYSKTIYKKLKERVIIICPIHGEFEQAPNNHLSGKGCSQCSKNKRLTTEIFVNESIKIHGNKYDYSKVNYINNHTKVIITCPIHGDFLQTPSIHLRGCGCPFCSNNIQLTNEEFIKRSREIHGNKYDYSKVNYINIDTPVIIICPIHGEFKQSPSSHLLGRGCPSCGYLRVGEKLSSNTEEFTIKSRLIHGDKYDYSLVNYINAQSYVTIICPIHGIFNQRASNHLLGVGCPKCRFSRGEEIVSNYLKERKLFILERENIYGVSSVREYVVPDFRILLESKEVWIEYNGIQHYKATFNFGNKEDAKKRLLDQITRDRDVREYCKNNNIFLVEVPYTIIKKDDVYDFLDKVLFEKIDPNSLVDYASLFVLEDNNST